MTPLQRAADRILRDNHGTGLREWLCEQRDDRVPYRLLARDLRDMTDGAIDVTDVTLINWHEAFLSNGDGPAAA